jgi:hypothetical protein
MIRLGNTYRFFDENGNADFDIEIPGHHYGMEWHPWCNGVRHGPIGFQGWIMNKKTIDRNFGDCEIRTISFMNGSAYLKFFDPVETTFFTLIIHAFGNLLFETNHFQNVIDSVHLYNSLDEAKSDPAALAFLTKIDPAMLDADGLKFAYIQPIAGGETFISFKSLEIEE